MSMPARSILQTDPFALEVIWGRLVAVADEMQTVLRRTAFSTIVAAANDLGCEIMDPRGWSVAHAVTSNPTFNRVLTHFAQALLKDWPADRLRPGDVVITNDPWLLTGHLLDFGVLTPFFKDGRFLGFTGSIAHVADIGGLLNQGLARSVYEEGVFFPPLKLYDGSVRNETFVSVLRSNVRSPEMVMGDITALVTANAIAAREVLNVLDEYRLTDLEAISDSIQDRAEQAMRRAIDAIPDGDYPFSVTFDELDGPMQIGVVVHVRGSNMDVEFVQVPPEHPHGGINVTLTYTVARCTYALNCILVPELASSEGLFRPITVRAPEATILNARYPASVNDRTKVGWHIESLVFGALGKVLPDKVPAEGGFKAVTRFWGTNDLGHAYTSFMFNGGGLGAGLTTDGVDAICYPTSACNVPIEILEASTSAFVFEKELRPDSGGPGRMRGGMGLRVTVGVPEGLDRLLTVGAGLHHQGCPPFGAAGGRDGTVAEVRLNGRTLLINEVRHALGALVVRDPDTRVTVDTPGGGGFGDPAERDPSRVLADVRNGFVSIDAAARDYGVEVHLDQLSARRVRKPDCAASGGAASPPTASSAPERATTTRTEGEQR